MTDTAEYWNNIKQNRRVSKRTFVHVKGLNCGHYHVMESDKFEDIDCYACLNLIKEKANEKK